MAGIKISDLPAAPSAQLTDVFPVDQLPGPVTYKESNSQLLSLFKTTGEALTKVDDTNVTMVLGGSPNTALLNATSMTLGWTGQLAVPRGGTGNSSFTAYSVICAGTTATGVFQNVVGLGTSGQQLTSNGPGALPTWQASGAVTPAALTKADDTNVTLTLGGTPATALLQAVSITAGWTGVLAETRGGTGTGTYTLGDTLYASAANTLSKLPGNITTAKQYLSQTGTGAVSAAPAWATISGGDITGAALTKTDDTNVTMVLGGTPTTALLQATSMTLGWTGQLSLTRGGTNASLTASNGGMVYSDASALAILAGTATAGQIVRSGASAVPTWSTATYPATAGTSGNVLTSDGTNWISSAPSGTVTIGKQVLSGSGNYTATAGTRFIWVRAVAGGGGGGGAAGAATIAVGGGGGAGGYGEYWGAYSAPIAYAVGAAGTGGTAGNTGGTGGATTFGTAGAFLNLAAGVGGASNQSASVAFALGGAGGAATTAAFGIAGGSGQAAIAPATTGGVSGAGAASPFGSGGNGVGNANNAGVSGFGYGSGGSGAVSTGNQAGGAGAIGTIVVFEFA